MTEEPSSEPPTTEPPFICRGNLNVTKDDDCELVQETYWTRIDVNSGRCNALKGDLIISDNQCLEELVFHARSFQLMESLTISNNTNLETIITEIDSCFKTKKLTLSSLIIID